MSFIGMDLDWRILIIIWLISGIASSMLVYWDMDRRKKVQGIWALLCIPLSILGILIYMLVTGRIKDTGRELPPKSDYGKPEYRFKDEPKPAAKAEPQKDAAPVEPVPTVKVTSQKPQKVDEPFPEPPAAEEPPAWKEEKPAQRKQIDGLPRCPKCGSAVSSFDAVCGDCGAKLK